MATVRCYSTSRLHDEHSCRPFLYVTRCDAGEERLTVDFAVLWRDGGSDVHEGWLFHTGRAAAIEVRGLSLRVDGSLALGEDGPRLSVGDELDFGWFEFAFEFEGQDLAGQEAVTVAATAVLALSCRSVAEPDQAYRLPPYHTVAGMEKACTEADLGVMLGGEALREADGAVGALVPVVDAALSVVWGLRTARAASGRAVSPHLLQSLRMLITLARRASGAETAGKPKPCFSVVADLARGDEGWHRVYGGLRLLATLAFSPQYKSEHFGVVGMKTSYRTGLDDLGFVCLQHLPPAEYRHELYQVGTTCAEGAKCALPRPEGSPRTVLQEQHSGGLACLACNSREPEDPWAEEPPTPEEAVAPAAVACALPSVDPLPGVDEVVFERRVAVHDMQRRARWANQSVRARKKKAQRQAREKEEEGG